MDCVPDSYTESMAVTSVLEQLEPQVQTGEFVRDLDRWPAIMRPLLIRYENNCHRLVETLWNRSLVDWMIKTETR